MSRRHHRPWTPSDADRAVASALGGRAAFLPDGDATLFVRGSVLELALAVWERAPHRAHTLLRQRIRTVHPLEPLDRDVLVVAARRAAQVPPARGPVPGPLVDLAADLAAAEARIRSAATAAEGRMPPDAAAFLAALVPPAAPRPPAERDRPVIALLADDEGRIVGAARNAGGANRVLHAELNLVYGRRLAGGTLYTSLQPCRMCAALIVAAAEAPVAVRYLEADPGRLARNTALQARGWESALVG